MNEAMNKRAYISTLAMLSMIFHTIGKPFDDAGRAFMKWFNPRRQRDILAGLIGALIAIMVARATFSGFPVEIIDISASIEETPATAIEPIANEEAENIARVLYGVKDYQLSENAKIAIIETIFSRVECSYGEFGDTINEVCLKPLQWQGFVEGSDYLKEDYELALRCLNDTSGARVTPEGCYWFIVSRDGVTVRTEFEGGNSWKVS